MMNSAASPQRRMQVDEASVPALARGARLRFDEARGVWVLLVPERILAPDDTAVEVLQLCDGDRSVAGIVDQLADKYTASRAEILEDVIEMLQELANSGYLVNAQGSDHDSKSN